MHAVLDAYSPDVARRPAPARAADLLAFLPTELRPGDVCLTLGAGDITTLGPELLTASRGLRDHHLEITRRTGRRPGEAACPTGRGATQRGSSATPPVGHAGRGAAGHPGCRVGVHAAAAARGRLGQDRGLLPPDRCRRGPGRRPAAWHRHGRRATWGCAAVQIRALPAVGRHRFGRPPLAGRGDRDRDRPQTRRPGRRWPVVGGGRRHRTGPRASPGRHPDPGRAHGTRRATVPGQPCPGSVGCSTRRPPCRASCAVRCGRSVRARAARCRCSCAMAPVPSSPAWTSSTPADLLLVTLLDHVANLHQGCTLYVTVPESPTFTLAAGGA